ncbi:MAG TPA: SUMF1/EgtB/PvdO family nonheme iron enzyme [Propionibacteriaceae bacterium]|nr:SUMF1/EgtB/PvdO family nonheme iron enzyme [Propionibacteriaceae bacterium]
MEFAEHLDVTDRVVSKWEKGGDATVPRPYSQAKLDHFLARSDANVQGRFSGILTAANAVTAQLVEADENYAVTEKYIKHPGDGRLMAPIPEGIFLAGKDNEPTWLDAFEIDVFPVTNADYARFCAATGRPTPQHWDGGRCPRELYDRPVVYVSWHDASAYASWAGKTLPTALQWEKAARGTAGNIYPWGDARTAAKCNVKESNNGCTTPISRYHSGVSPFGVYDMIGNVWEWCQSTRSTGKRDLKGSAWSSSLLQGDAHKTNDANDFMQDDDTGFRCAKWVLPSA